MFLCEIKKIKAKYITQSITMEGDVVIATNNSELPRLD